MPRYSLIDDGFQSELVTTAFFDGVMEIPIIEKPDKYVIPTSIVPFSCRRYDKGHNSFICFYEHDRMFADFLQSPKKYLSDISQYPGIISPDCSLYIDMPLILQIYNVYRNRAIGYYLQKQGIYVIPNIRWGDERTYTTVELPEKIAFLGVPKHSIISIGTYGCVKTNENQRYFREGLIAMLEELEPEIALVYGQMPNKVFQGLENRTRFIRFDDWIRSKKGGKT